MVRVLDRDVDGIGSMGSLFRTYRFRPEEIPILAEIDWNRLARRVFIDPITGLIALMSPSSEHENYAGGIDRLVQDVSLAMGTRVVTLGSTRWRRPGDPERTGAEPDACFYLGEKAQARARARHDGPETLAAFEANHPPDLVVEIELSHGDSGKPLFYREVGVAEMWRLDLRLEGLKVEMLNLEAPDGPIRLDSSFVLPLCTPDFVRAALDLAVDGRLRELDDLVAHAAASAPKEDRQSPTTAPPGRVDGTT